MAAIRKSTKTCPACKTEQPLENYYRNKASWDGLQVYCRRCVYEKYLELTRDPKRLAKRRAQKRAESKSFYKKHREACRASSHASYVRYPYKVRARSKVYLAIRSGTLVKPKTCSCCYRTTPPKKLHGHHNNYSRPLDVEWLCTGCHGDRDSSRPPTEPLPR